MTEPDLSSLPWSINRDDYELQEVIGECGLGGTTSHSMSDQSRDLPGLLIPGSHPMI